MTINFKVGDLIYYVSDGSKVKNYTVIKKITDERLWGVWYSDINRAKRDKAELRLTFMPPNECFLVNSRKIKNWKEVLDL